MKPNIFIRFSLCLFFGIFFIGCEDSTQGEPPYEGPPKEIITVKQAFEMYGSYSTRRVPLIQRYEDSISDDSSKFTPTRYAEYELKAIKQYIAYIEHEAKEAGVNVNTLRFYLANYPDSGKFDGGAVVRYPRRNTFFVVPTTDIDGKNEGFSIEEINGKPTAVAISRKMGRENGAQKSQSDTTAQVNEAGFFMPNSTSVQGSGTTSLILNDGSIVPPPGTDDFDTGD